MEEAKPSSKHEDDVDVVWLPEDIILNLLVRLPANDLCRFRCVSRAWNAIISDPTFVAAQRSQSHAGRLIAGMFGSWPDYELRVLDMHGNILRVLETMENALLAPTRLDLIICVDSLRLGTMIVDPAAAAGRTSFTVGRNDDTDTTWSHSSFGRATPSGAYKVMDLHLLPIESVCDVATITEGGASELTWRQMPPPPFDTCFTSEHKATVNGVLYFMPYNPYARTTYGWNRIVAFDLESEAWMEPINGPPTEFELEQKKWRIVLTELKGTLCMVQNIEGPAYVGGGPYANIWRLIDYNQCVWVKEYVIQMPKEYCLYIKPLDVLDDGIILLLNKGCSRYILQFFNPSTKAFTDIMEMAEGFTGRMTFYTGSLL